MRDGCVVVSCQEKTVPSVEMVAAAPETETGGE